MIYIPDGSKKEPPTTFMSITNQTYYTSVVRENIGDKKGVKEQNPTNIKKEEVKPSIVASTSKTASSVFNEIKKAGDSVRELKANKAPKVS